MTTIGDLIDIPRIEPVIKIAALADNDPQRLREQIFDTFVLTDEALGGIDLVLRRMTRRETAGFIVKGGYGAGKSHFLAFLGAIAENPDLFQSCTESDTSLQRYCKHFFPGEILTVAVPLTSYPRHVSLEDAVLDAIGKKLIAAGIDLTSFAQKALDDFRKIAAHELVVEYAAGAADGTPTQEMLRLTEFLRTKNISFRPALSRDDLYDVIERACSKSHPGGMLLLLDEVSEFLRSRSETDVTSEDIRFLQFLGEWRHRYSCWTVLSMQEDIEETSRASEVSLNKIRDRFANRIFLSTTHIRELLEKRLSIKKPGSRDGIAAVYARYREYFPSWQVPLDEFYAMYPVHPATLYTLESVTSLFSKTRGMVEFFFRSLHATDPQTGTAFIDHAPERLLTPDRVFDHFRDKIQENKPTNIFIDRIFREYARAIPFQFQDPAEREAALALVKILILNEICPDLPRLTVRRLAEITGRGIDPADPDVNLDFINHVLDRLMESHSFIRKEPAADPYETVCFLTVEKTIADRFEEEVQKNASTIVQLPKKALAALIRSCSRTRLPLANFYERESVLPVVWEETSRKILLTLHQPARITGATITEWQSRIDRGEIEYVLIMGYPVEEAAQTDALWELLAQFPERIQQAVYYWMPQSLDPGALQAISDVHARAHTFSELKRESPGYFGESEQEITVRLAARREEALDSVIDTYFPPDIRAHGGTGVLGEMARVVLDCNQLTHKLTTAALSTRYPEHRKIKPMLMEPVLQGVAEIMTCMDANLTGTETTIPSPAMLSLLKNLTEKLHLIRVAGTQVTIAPDPGRSVFVREILKHVETHKPSFADLFAHFRTSPYGATEPQFMLCLYILALGGFLRFGSAAGTHRPELQQIRAAEKILPGEQVSDAFMQHAARLVPLVGQIRPSQLHLKGQETVWDQLKEKKTELMPLTEKLRALLTQYSGSRPFTAESFSTCAHALKRLQHTLGSVKLSLDSSRGITAVIEAIDSAEALQSDLDLLEQYRDLPEAALQQVVFMYGYLNDARLLALLQDSDLMPLYQNLIEALESLQTLCTPDALQTIVSSFDDFHISYRYFYQRLHQQAYPDEYYRALETVSGEVACKTLQCLSCIEVVSVRNDFHIIRDRLHTALAGRCTRSIERELQRSPVCPCGAPFTGESEPQRPGREDLLECAGQGIVEYLTCLQQPPLVEKLQQQVVALEQVDKTDEARALSFFLTTDTDTAPAGSEMARYITPWSISLINEALRGNVKIVRKSIKPFFEALRGRKYRPRQIREIFERWLNEQDLPAGDVYLELDTPGAPPLTTGDEPHMPEQIPAIALNHLRRLHPGLPEHQALQRCLDTALHISFHQAGLAPPVSANEAGTDEVRRNILSAIPSSVDLYGLLPEEARLRLQHQLLPERLEPAALLELYSRTARFSGLRTVLARELYSRGSAIEPETLATHLIDSSPETRILHSFFRLLHLRHQPLALPDTFSAFARSAVAAWSDQLEAQSAISRNRTAGLLPETFAEHFAGTIADRIVRIENHFAARLQDWDTEHTRISRPLTSRARSGPMILLIIDGMRADLYPMIADMLVKKCRLLCEKEQHALCLLPSITETFDLLLQQLGIPVAKAIERPTNNAAFRTGLLAPAAGHRAYSTAILDERLHSESAPLAAVVHDTLPRLEELLCPVVSAMEPGTVFHLTSDHGFAETCASPSKGVPRYTHGGTTCMERIITLARFRKL